MEDIQILNSEICQLHNDHYKNSPNGLLKPDEAPNSNIIYHLYNDGMITSQKGGFAYLLRTENIVSIPLYQDVRLSPFKFPKKTINDCNYVILTEKECLDMRKKMSTLLKK